MSVTSTSPLLSIPPSANLYAAGKGKPSTGVSPAANGSENTSPSSTTVSISPNAAAFASFEEQGIEAKTVSFGEFAEQQVFKDADVDGNGFLSEKEFDRFASGATKKRKEELEELYKSFDENGDGTVSGGEFKKGVTNAVQSGDSTFDKALAEPFRKSSLVGVDTVLQSIRNSAAGQT